MKAFIYIASLQVVFGATLFSRADITDCNPVCIKIYKPVCGTDGQTYGNQCMLDYAICLDSTISLQHPGQCQPACPDVMCPALYDPVCGSDGKTYSNKCTLNAVHCHGDVTVDQIGPC